MAMGKVRTDSVDLFSGLPVVVAYGEVDLATAPEMENHLSTALGTEGDVAVDLSGASFLDSVALGVLTRALERCEEKNRRLFLIIGDPRVLRVFELTGLITRFPIFASRAELERHLAEIDSR